MKSTQSDKGLGFDGAEVVARRDSGKKFAHNQWSGHSNDGRTMNMGRGPVKGNDGSCHHSGMAQAGKKPPTSAVPAVPKQGSVRDSINRGPQVRNPGGTRAFDPKCCDNYNGNPDRMNAGRGPTKGNQQ
jgi:hypothetical protein